MPDLNRVIIAGGGPVGLTAAVRLALEGIPVTVLEAEPHSKTDWRASTFHGSTLQVLEPTGVVPQMLQEGLQAPTYQLRDKQRGLVAGFDFRVLADELKYPYRLQLNQQHLVRMLLERLRELPAATVRFDTRLVGFTQDAAGVHVRSHRGGHFYGSFLFGADGASSTVRRLLGVSFEGMTYAERFSIVSFIEDPSESIPGLAYVNYVADPTDWFFVLRTPESWRMLFPIPPEESDETALSDARIEERLQKAAPRATPYTLLDRQIYRVHQRVAGELRVGRVLLMGDAAHVNSPIGGVGLNSGIHDASDAAVRVLRLMSGGSDASAERVDAELGAYDAIRRKVALEYVQKDTHQNTLRMGESDAERRQREQAEMAAIAADRERARTYLRRVSLLEPVQLYGIGRAAEP
jgi:2-polyprenyl-6-methoxyphenol hydroxylase-like FAD-dependent oxidoreductase